MPAAEKESLQIPEKSQEEQRRTKKRKTENPRTEK